MDFLQAPDTDGVAPAGLDGLDGGFGAGHCGDAGDSIRHRVAADRFFVGEGVRAAGGGVDDQVERTGFQQIHGIRPAFIYFENGFRLDSGGADGGGGAAGRGNLESQRVEAFRQGDGDQFVAIVDADEDPSLVGQRLAGG